MKLLLIGLDGIRLDIAVPSALSAHEGFAHPDHPSDPQFMARPDAADASVMPPPSAVPAAPVLAGLLEHGAILPVWMTPPTISGPCWSSLLTGTTNAEHNVWDNDFVQHRLDQTPDILTRLHAADRSARTFAAASWAPIVDAAGPGPIIAERAADQATGKHRVMVATDLTRGYISADEQVCDLAAHVLRQDGPDGTFVHLDSVDEAGHESGAKSSVYRDAISAVDRLVGHLVGAVAGRADQQEEEWLVAVVTDHGHTAEGGHGQDQTEVRRSFLLVRRFGPASGGEDPELGRLADRGPLRSEQVTPLLLELLGVTGPG